jgi:hypothetical protein
MSGKQKLRSIVMQVGGQGDGIMAASGLQALLELGIPFLEDDSVCFTRSLVRPVIKIMLSGINIALDADSKRAPRPRYHLISKISWTTVFRNYFAGDIYFGFAERRRLASYNCPPQKWTGRLQQYLMDKKLSSGTRWLRETPSYYGLKMWAPVAENWRVSETALLRGLYASYQTVSERIDSYIKNQTRLGFPSVLKEIAIFPGGGSFQFLPPEFIRIIITELGLNASRYTCFFAPGDDLINRYKKAHINCDITHSVDDMLMVIAHADVTITSDSFASHLAQIAAREHIALMSHDLPQHTIHPAARSTVVFEPLDCCPCYYTSRNQQKLCPAGYSCCAVFLSYSYRKQAVLSIKKVLARETPAGKE